MLVIRIEPCDNINIKYIYTKKISNDKMIKS
jgi:hypothetical protein